MLRFTAHKYCYTHPFASDAHHWELRGPRGAIHFHVNLYNDPRYNGPSCGLEYHHAFDPTGGQEAPHHVNCSLTGGRCWHEGTSLYATEHLWPRIEPFLRDGSHQQIFRILEKEYDSHFGRYESQTGEGETK